MTQTRKMQDGNKTPTLYSFYEDQYDFNDLSRKVDSGINAHISTLKKGKKYEKEFREAVANIMSGIKDGTVTFGNGRFNDSLGRYSNVEDKDKDVYGWAANYVYNNMQNIPKYVKQDTSNKYDNTILSKELSNIIFGSENGDLSYFWDVDPLDTSTNTRGIQGRLSVLGEAISQINPDTLLKDYSQEDRDRVRNQLQQVTTAISNRQLDPGELLTLGKVFGGINWNNWLKTDFNKVSQEQQEPQQENGLSRDQFLEYVSSTHPLYQGDLESVTLNNTVQSDELEQLAQRLSRYDNRTLQLIDIDKLDNDSKAVTLDFLISRNLLPQSDGVYIIPNSLKNETVLAYNPKTQQLSRKRTHELSYYRKQWINDYTQQHGNPTDQLSQYFTEFKKNGGIIKAESGVKFTDNANWYSGVFLPQFDHILQGLKKDLNYYKWLNDMQSQHSNLYKLAGSDFQNTAYKDNLVGKYQDLYKSGYNNEWEDNTAGYNSLGIQNAQNQQMFDISGNKRTSGDWNGNGNNWNTDNLYSAITDYRRLLGRKEDFSPEQLQEVSKKLKDVGYDIYLDKDNYYKLRPYIQPAKIAGNPDLFDSPELDISLKSQKKTYVTPRANQKSNKTNFDINGISNILLDIAPDLISAGRLFSSLRTNNNVAKTINQSLKPILKDTYERYSPITGAFGEMQFRNNQAADLRRQASRPFTSDASLQLAGQLEADRQARDLEYQGFLADNNEIKRTQEAALARQEDNMARRSEVANFNRASMNQTNREKAQLEATRLKRNWQSVDNFLQGVEGRLRTNLAERKALRQNSSLQLTQANYQDAIQKAGQLYKDSHPNGTTEDMLKDPQYLDRIKKLRSRYQYELYNIGQGRYLKNPYQDNVPLTYEQILSAKNGGRLRPSIMTMINKVIKNESYT